MIYQHQQLQPVHKFNRKFLFIALGILAIFGLAITLWVLRQRTLQNPHAAAATTLSFTPTSLTVAVGSPISSDIMVDPSTNKVSLVKIILSYDNTKIQVTSDNASLTPNTSLFPQTLDTPKTNCNGSSCTLSATFSVGSDPTKAIQSKATVATFHAQLIAASTSPIVIPFTTTSAVYSIASTDQAAENVLSSTSPLTIVTQGGACIPNQSSCSWDSMDNVTTYHYTVVESGSGQVVQQGDVNAPQTNISFPSLAGKTYNCSVTAVNVCGKGSVGSGSSTCPLPSTSPTPSVCEGPGDVTNIKINCPNCQGQ